MTNRIKIFTSLDVGELQEYVEIFINDNHIQSYNFQFTTCPSAGNGPVRYSVFISWEE